MSKIIDHTGEKSVATNGMKMTIIAYRRYKDIDIQFEDGTIVYNKSYDGFKKGYIKYCKHRVGETNIANNGMKMTIIKYRKSYDIDIQFEDGTIVYNKKYSAFKRGVIKHPNIDAQNVKIVTERTGKTRMMNCGLKATIINYHNCDNIDVQFEDGTIVYNRSYHTFNKGATKHPNINVRNIRKIAKHTNEVRTMNCGLKATIINYHDGNHIDIQFENNTIVYNKSYDSFKKGKIAIPKIINNIKLKEFAYKFNNDWYYICSHPTWMEDKILSIKEIYAYQSKQVA